MKIGELSLNLIVAWNNQQEKKVLHYEICLMRCKNIEPLCIGNPPKWVDFTKHETILRTKITKKKAKELMDMGYPIFSGYFRE